MKKPIILIHGGAGTKFHDPQHAQSLHLSIRAIATLVAAKLKRGLSAVEAVKLAVQCLEDDELYNAGRGSKLQSDGVIRMSASLMNGASETFSGVLNIEKVKNPIKLVALLQKEKDRVLDGMGGARFAKKHKLAFGNPYTKKERERYLQKKRGKSGTVGAVALDLKGRLAAATSTGGKGFEVPGRVSDSPTVAGNYANKYCAVSCTGTGESIVDHALAAALVTRVEDGLSIKKAASLALAKAKKYKSEYGFIALDHKGFWIAEKTTPVMTWAYCDGKTLLSEP